MNNQADTLAITFVVIALNEERVIERCLGSIQAIAGPESEVICVDSGSVDGTLDKILSYCQNMPNLSVYSVVGEVNAAVARNVGLRNATRPLIFFVDGDTELDASFISCAAKHLLAPQAGAVIGKLAEHQYEADFESLKKCIEDRFKINCIDNHFLGGGTFLVKKSVTDQVGFFDEKLKYNEDRDYQLRIRGKFTVSGIPKLMGIHHTVNYDMRAASPFENRTYIYFGLFFCKHIDNLSDLVQLIRQEIGMFIGLLNCVVLIIVAITHAELTHIYMCAILFFTYITAKIKNQKFIYRFSMYFFYPTLYLLGITSFFLNCVHSPRNQATRVA